MWDILERTHKDSSGTAWLDNDMSSSGSSFEVSKTNMCLMTKEESASNSVSTNSSINAENYYKLLVAFKDTHEEAYRLTLSNNQLKIKIKWLENRIKVLEKELNNSKTNFENLEMIYQNSSCKCESNSCKKCKSLQKKVLYLVKTMNKISKGKSNFENVLTSQNRVFRKFVLGFNPQRRHSGISKPFSTITEKQPIEKSKQQVVSCFYYMRKGHSVRFFKIRKVYVPSGVLKWVRKNPKVPNNQVNLYGPKFIKGPNLATSFCFFACFLDEKQTYVVLGQ